jgi:hypothetical protein
MMVVLVALVAGGCGASSDDEAVRDVANRFREALADRDAKTFCSLMEPDAQALYQVVGEESCEAFMRGRMKSAKESGLRALGQARVESVRITGTTAVVEFSGLAGSASLRKIDGSWRIAPSGR